MSNELFFNVSSLSDEEKREARASFQRQSLAVYEAARVMGEQALHLGKSITQMFAQDFGVSADVGRVIDAIRNADALPAIGSIARLFGETESPRSSAARAIAEMMRHAQSECLASSSLASIFAPRADVEAEGVM